MAIQCWFDSSVLDGHAYSVDEKTGRREKIDAEAARENLNEHIATLYLLDVFTNIAPPTATDILKFSNKFVESMRIFKAESIKHGSEPHVGKQK